MGGGGHEGQQDQQAQATEQAGDPLRERAHGLNVTPNSRPAPGYLPSASHCCDNCLILGPGAGCYNTRPQITCCPPIGPDDLPIMEINAVKSEIKALRARFDALRGYL